MTREQYDRGRRWAAGLREVARWQAQGLIREEAFDLTVWCYQESDAGLVTHSQFKKLTLDDIDECGFAGCAVGWLPYIMPDDFIWAQSDPALPDSLDVLRRGGTTTRSFMHDEIAEWFGVTVQEARSIVYDSYYNFGYVDDGDGMWVKKGVRPEQVADRIDEILTQYNERGWAQPSEKE